MGPSAQTGRITRLRLAADKPVVNILIQCNTTQCNTNAPSSRPRYHYKLAAFCKKRIAMLAGARRASQPEWITNRGQIHLIQWKHHCGQFHIRDSHRSRNHESLNGIPNDSQTGRRRCLSKSNARNRLVDWTDTDIPSFRSNCGQMLCIHSDRYARTNCCGDGAHEKRLHRQPST